MTSTNLRQGLSVLQPGKERDQSDRYSRHDLYFGVAGYDGDPRPVLRNASVGLIGAGGVGSHVAMVLAAAGVGRLVVADAGVVETVDLTRQFLYTEGDVGAPKVEALARRIAERNGEVGVDTVDGSFDGAFDGPRFVVDHFADCDLVVLSAGTSEDVRRRLNEAAVRIGLPYICAGHRDTVGIVGPLVVPGETACLECDSGPTGLAAYDDGEPERTGFAGLNDDNRDHQAHGYGPLDAWVSATTANETLRYLLGLHVRTLDTRLLLESTDYDVKTETCLRNPTCASCGVPIPPPAPAPFAGCCPHPVPMAS